MYVPTYSFGLGITVCPSCGKLMVKSEDDTLYGVSYDDIVSTYAGFGMPAPSGVQPGCPYDIVFFFCNRCNVVMPLISQATEWKALKYRHVLLYEKPDWMEQDYWIEVITTLQVQKRRDMEIAKLDPVHRMVVEAIATNSPDYPEITRRLKAGRHGEVDFIAEQE